MAALDSLEFRLERGWAILMSALSAFMVGLAVLFIAATAQHGWVLALLIGIPIVAINAWVMVRCFAVKVAFDRDALQIIGPFWSRRIRRVDVVSVDDEDLDLPWVEWAGPGGRTHNTRLFALGLPFGISWTPVMGLSRRRFLVRLRRWAQSTPSPFTPS